MGSDPRPPAVAGSFYPADGKSLAKLVEACFLDRRGPGALPPRRRSSERHVRAIVAPHAGLVYSGAIAAHAFAAVAADRPARHLLILGVDHHGLAAGPALSARPWTTPLGPVPPDPELVAALTRPPVSVDEAAHRREHSIEVELPFVQYVEPTPIVAELMVPFATLPALRRVAAAVRAGIDGRDVLLVASTDFSHYVSPREADRLDHLALEAIVARDADRLYETVQTHGISMCGIAPTTVLLAALQGEELDGELLAWGHSGDVEPMAEVVGYASVAFRSVREL